MIEALADQAFAHTARAVEDGRLPGATLGLVTRDGARAVRVAGHAALVPTPEPLVRDHWFDLASLTKVIATTPMILTLAARGLLDLDAPLTTAIPDLRQYDMDGAAERRLTFRDCLAHRTHLPAVEPIYTYGDDPARLRAFVLQREWRAGPPVYSDINFILLGIAIERLTGASLHAWPLGTSLSYRPFGPAVATEACPWRGRVLKGEVHDENAFALGGSAGHAGLFGTVDGVLDFAAATLANPPAEIRVELANHRSCGWEVRHPGWSGGDACSAATIGHTGFTGTGLWLDFARGLGWTLLSNRIHPTRHRDSGIFEIRPATGDAVVAAFDARTRTLNSSSQRKLGSP
jgi:CubicO group peptidase (beta-lactamase class C family)